MSAWVEAADFCEKRALPNGRKGYPDSGQDMPEFKRLYVALTPFALGTPRFQREIEAILGRCAQVRPAHRPRKTAAGTVQTPES
jgi:hypothetical protein